MATIRQQAELVIKHPFFREAMKKASTGDMSGFERLFLEMMCHVWERCALDASREYGKFHRLNHMDIKRNIRDLSPPEGLDLKLPIPDPTITFLPIELTELDFMIQKEQVIIPITGVEAQYTRVKIITNS